MDSQQLKYIVTIAECQSISKAAEQLFISQSGLNQKLIRLEKELGVRLFERDTHHLQITEAGSIFLLYAREALNREQQMQVMMQDAMNGAVGQLRLNLAMEIGIELFVRILPIFYEKYPRIELRLEDHIVYDQYRLLLDGKLDIGMVMVKTHEIEELEYVPIATERFLLGIPASHPLAQLYQPTEDGDYPEMDLALCRHEKFSLMFSGSTFRQVIDPCFANADYIPNILFESRTNHIPALMTASGLCLTILPESQARLYQNICWFRMENNPTWECCLVYPKENPPIKAGRYLIQLAVQYSKDLGRKSTPDWSLCPLIECGNSADS